MLISVSRRCQLRVATTALIIVAATFLLFGLFEKNTQANRIAPSEPIIVLLPTFLIAFVHLIYLWLVNYLTLISRPIQRLGDSIDYIFPTLLSICYILSGSSYLMTIYPTARLSSVPLSDALSFLSLIIFGVLYLLWGSHDLHVFRSTTVLSRKVELIFWLIIDFVFGLFAIWSAFSTLGWLSKVYVHPYLDIKDIAILFSIGTFAFFRFCFRWLQKWLSYQAVYSQFLERVSVIRHYPQNAPVIASLSDHISSWSRMSLIDISGMEGRANPNAIRFLDYGCADGRRAVEFCRIINSEGVPATFELHGVDANPSWGPFFDSYLDRVMDNENMIAFRAFYSRNEFYKGLNEGAISKFDIMYFSHFLYGENEYRDFKNIVKNARNDSIIIVRGFGPKSLFWIASSVKSTYLLGPSMQSLWLERYVKHICDDCSLRRLNSSACSQSILPDLTVVQKVSLFSRQDAVALCNLIEFLYGVSAREFIEVYIQDLKKAEFVLRKGKSALSLPSEDVIFCYHPDRHR